MKTKILYIERKYWGFVSIEKVFEQVSINLSTDNFDFSFIKLEYGNNLGGIIKNLLFFRKTAADIYHITGHIHYLALILPRKNTVLTIHDLRFLELRKGLRRLVLKKIFLDLPVKKLKYITAISEATKNEILANTDCRPEKIRIIENPIQKLFFSEVEKKINKECPLILQIGTLPNKNVPNLIRALHGINCRLRLIGRMDKEIITALRENNINYENAFELNDTEMRTEYENADLVSFCSTYEGFGLPVIEAQAMRTPLITSKISPLIEVSGGAAYLADPSNVADIRRGIRKIIQDDQYRNEIVRAGTENVKRFYPEKIAESYEKLYEEILSSNQ